MSEDEWMSRDWPTSMLKLVDSLANQPRPRWKAKVVQRQLRLAACAACRRIERLLDAPRRNLVEVAEQYALGQASWREFQKAAGAVGDTPEPKDVRDDGRYYAAKAVGALPDDAATVIGFVLSASLRDPDQPEALTGYCAGLLRCLFGNPYQPLVASFAHEWRTDTVLGLARTMYESRDFGAMPILADALQDAGCDNEAILSHCRDATLTHVRGCWVVDGVLGKA
jgi:hypothetical protein